MFCFDVPDSICGSLKIHITETYAKRLYVPGLGIEWKTLVKTYLTKSLYNIMTLATLRAMVKNPVEVSMLMNSSTFPLLM